MSESKYTLGPWSLEFDDVPYDGGFETMVINGENGSICMMDCPKDDMEANGRLIAAAPDLLAALEEIVARNEIQDWFNLDQARAAIAKATGESHD